MLHYLHLYTKSLILTKVVIQCTQPLVMTDMGAHTHVCLSRWSSHTHTHCVLETRSPGNLTGQHVTLNKGMLITEQRLTTFLPVY